MGDKRRAIMAFLMLTMLIGQTVAVPLIIPIAVGFVASSVFGYWLGILDSENYQELIQQYEAQLTSNTIKNDINTRLYLQEIYARDNNVISLGQDLLQYSRNYAWALAKYEALKVLDTELNNGTNFTTAKTLAKQAAHNAVYDYYWNLTLNTLAINNETAELFNYSLNYYAENIAIYDVVADVLIDWYSSYSGSWTYDEPVNGIAITKTNTVDVWSYTRGNGDILQVETATTTVLGKTISYKILKVIGGTWDKTNNNYDTNHDVEVTKLYLNGTEVYNRTMYENMFSKIDSEYNMINANIDAYIDGLAQDYVNNWNITQLIDPYILAGLLNNDLNSTGYYGYAAAELALLGLNTTGINKTINITVYDANGNATTLEGWLFTDWTGTLETGKNYTANSSYKWFFVADGGLYDLTGYNFTVGTIKDWQGNELTNVTLTRYVSHTGDVLKMYDELAQIRQLYEEYINNLQAMAAGGSGGGSSLSEWWASLDQTAKIGVIAIGAVGVYAILGRRK